MTCFGPVPSRRLGHSLGINNIPPKICTYSCVYCQMGTTIKMLIDRQPFYRPEVIFAAVQKRVEADTARGEPIDYLTFVSDGEPTLEVNLHRQIDLLRPLRIRTAVITNSSLCASGPVREDLVRADLVSLKVDAISEEVWRRLNRPHRQLNLDRILDSIVEFARNCNGEVITETMLIAGVNDGEEELGRIAAFLTRVKPNRAYVAIPTRPPTEKWVQPASEESINMAYQTFGEALGYDQVEYLVGYEGNAFASSGDAEEDLLSITAVHPMRREAVAELLARASVGWEAVETLIEESKLVELEYEGNRFYMRRLHTKR
ncbi:radical SAM protein [Chloroflexota bacterium]